MKCLILLLSVVALATCAPVGFFDDDDDFFKGFSFPDFSNLMPKVDCKSLGCPSDANSCSKKTETSKDKKTINTTVKCFQNGKEILEVPSSQPNPDPNAQVSEYSFYGSYTGENTNINIENHTGNAPDDKIEKFD